MSLDKLKYPAPFFPSNQAYKILLYNTVTMVSSMTYKFLSPIRIFSMKKQKTFTIRVEEKLWEFFKMQTIKQNKSLNGLINEALQEYKKNFQKKS